MIASILDTDEFCGPVCVVTGGNTKNRGGYRARDRGT
jgi:hypothetical protein